MAAGAVHRITTGAMISYRLSCRLCGTRSLSVLSSQRWSPETDGTSTSSSGGAESDAAIKERVLRASLQFVHKHGWSLKALAAGAVSVGLPGVAHGIFPRGEVELVAYFYTDCNQRLCDLMSTERDHRKTTVLEASDQCPMTEYSLVARLRMLLPYIDTWPEALSVRALPQNVPESLRQLLQMSDDVAHYSGDSSTDLSWYWKRLALASVYKSSEIHLIQDKSENYAETWRFVRRRLSDVDCIRHTFSHAGNTNNMVKQTTQGLMYLTRNLLGMNDRQRREPT